MIGFIMGNLFAKMENGFYHTIKLYW